MQKIIGKGKIHRHLIQYIESRGRVTQRKCEITQVTLTEGVSRGRE